MSEELKGLLEFLQEGKTSFHAVNKIAELLKEEGYQELAEHQTWKIEAGAKYFTTRNNSSLIAFEIPRSGYKGFQIVASHSDSPTFKLKEKEEIIEGGKYTRINVEGYGGMIVSAWFDRPLSVAGRIVTAKDNQVTVSYVDINRDLMMIPNLAIHMNRDVNNGYKYNLKKDLIPVIGSEATSGDLLKELASLAKVSPLDIVGKDLYLYNREEGKVWGARNEYFSAPRIDNLECAYTTLLGFLKAKKQNISLYCVFDNEEVGSATKQGAGSTFLADVLTRITIALGLSKEEELRMLADSFMVSADNAHALHPNYPEKADTTNRVYLNEGIVIKHNANQKYTTDGVSRGIFKGIMNQAKIKVQDYANPSDMPGGSTLGNISNTKVSLNTIDIGLPQLAMHSPYESAGVADVKTMIEAMKAFFETQVCHKSNNDYNISMFLC
ncbi:MAG TPA: M18 family aminopeptidase [Candidatus Dorea intestinavium]|nr:M18 family aminopeptidase [Candidatus Dorea intestinavium]